MVREVVFNPIALSFSVNGLEVREADQPPIIGFEELFVNLRATTFSFNR